MNITFITIVTLTLVVTIFLQRKYRPEQIGTIVFYEADYHHREKSVRAAWARMVAEKAPLGVLFEIPGGLGEQHNTDGLITNPLDYRQVGWDDQTTYTQLGVPYLRYHVLRVRHNNPVHDTVEGLDHSVEGP